MNDRQKRWRNDTSESRGRIDISGWSCSYKTKEVNKAIIEILGLNRKSISSNRDDCTGEIFKNYYWQIQKKDREFSGRFLRQAVIRFYRRKLKAESGKLSDELEFARRSVNQYLEGVLGKRRDQLCKTSYGRSNCCDKKN